MRIRLILPFLALCATAQPTAEIEQWKALRSKLLADEAYLNEIRETPLPVSSGFVVAMEPPVRPHTLLIGIETPYVAELRLEIFRDGLAARMTTTPQSKSRVHFTTARIESMTKRPFVLTAIADEMALDYEDPGAE